jgi:hypothetical protein
MEPRDKAKLLSDMGYRRVSNKYCIVSRVDREDWKEYMAHRHAPWDFDEGMRLVNMIGNANAAGYYRRAISSDTLTVDNEVYKLMKSSNGDPTGFIEEE